MQEADGIKMIAVRRRDLVKENGTAETHYISYNKHFNLTMIKRKSAKVDASIAKELKTVVEIEDKYFGVLEFYIKALWYIHKERKRANWNVVIGVIAEEPVAWFIQKLLLRKAKLIYDLWDIPGLNVHNKLPFVKRVLWWGYNKVLNHCLLDGDLYIFGVMKNGLSHLGIPENKVILSENGIVLERANNIKSVNSNYWNILGAQNKKKLIYIGYICEARGAIDILTIMRRLRDDNRDIHFLFVGVIGFEIQHKMEAMISDLELEQVVTIKSWLPFEELVPIVRASDLAVCPLHNIEQYKWSYPVKVYEYMALGVPIIASDLPGTVAIIKPEIDALIYKAGDVDGFYACVKRLLDDEEEAKRLSRNAKEHVKDKDRKILLYKLMQEIEERLKTVL
jgi:glycosyltransferase involved in cell wall biosynthesis